MSRTALSFTVSDASQFAKSLGQSLHARHAAGSAPPGHVELLNLLARALGHRNLQSLQAAAAAPALPALALAAEDRAPPPALSAHARKALTQFDSRGRLLRWPTKFSVQKLAMWVLWTLFDGRRVYTEREVNHILRAANAFGDHVTLRRELVDHGLLTRKSDCSAYRKCPARPDAEARALLQAWRTLRRNRSAEPEARDDSPRRRHLARHAGRPATEPAAASPPTAPS
jgi:hypothetical protein